MRFCRFACRVGNFMRTMQTMILGWLGMVLLLATPGCDPSVRLARTSVIPAHLLTNGGRPKYSILIRQPTSVRHRQECGRHGTRLRLRCRIAITMRLLNRFGPRRPKSRPSCRRDLRPLFAACRGVCTCGARVLAREPDRPLGLPRRFRSIAPAGYDGSFAARPE